MQADLDKVNGQPVLRLEKTGGYGYKRTVYDLKLTPEQAKQIEIHTSVVE